MTARDSPHLPVAKVTPLPWPCLLTGCSQQRKHRKTLQLLSCHLAHIKKISWWLEDHVHWLRRFGTKSLHAFSAEQKYPITCMISQTVCETTNTKFHTVLPEALHYLSFLRNTWLKKASISFLNQDHPSLESNPEGIKQPKDHPLRRPVGF